MIPKVIRRIPANSDMGHGEEVTISFRAKSWEDASRAMLHTHKWQPEGYSLIAAKISRRGKKGGKRCELNIVLRHTNRNVDPVDHGGWPDVLFDEARISQGLMDVAVDYG